jgi:peptide/nickel transport system substrate-binding protein
MAFGTFRRPVAVALTAMAAGAGLVIGQPVHAADDSVVVARAMDFNSLDPARGFCDTCQIYLTAVYDTLVTLGPDNKAIIPRLATKWEISPDLTSFTFHLNPAAKFADGTPVQAADVKWSLERLKNIKGGPSFLMDALKTIETPDPLTVVITTSAPSSEFLGILAASYAGIINSKLASGHGAKASADAASSDTADAWFLANSAGSGPFVLKSYKDNDELRLQRNDAFWGKKPQIGAVIMKQTADAVSQVQMLQSGAADVAMQVDPDTAKTIHDPNIIFKTVPSFNFVYMAFSPTAPGAPMELSHEVREALALAIDYKGVIDFTVGGDGKFQPAAIPNGFPGASGLPDPAQNLDKARALLTKANAASGLKLTLEFPAMNVYGVDLSLLAQKLQQDLGRINVSLDLKPVTFNVWIADLESPGIPFTIGFYAPDYFGSGQYVQYFAMVPDMPWGKRAGVGKTPGLDGATELAMFHKALASSGPAQDEAYHALGMKMIEDKIIVPLVSPDLVLAYRKNISGIRYSACCNLPLSEIGKTEGRSP